jgi:hypothetical protein
MSMGSCSALDDMIEVVRAMCLPWCSVNAISCGVIESATQMNIDLGVVSRRRISFGLALSLKVTGQQQRSQADQDRSNFWNQCTASETLLIGLDTPTESR